jgi:transposase-like protein
MNKSEDCQLVATRRYTRRDERLRIVAAWRQSGLSAVEYAEQAGITVRNLYRWKGNAGPEGEAMSFIELPAMPTGAWSAEVMSKSGSVRLSASACPSWAASLIRELNRC